MYSNLDLLHLTNSYITMMDNKKDDLISTLSDFDTTLVTYVLIIGSAEMTTVLPRNETTDMIRKRLLSRSHFSRILIIYFS